MTSTNREPILFIRAKGIATKDGSIPLQDLIQLGKHIQSAVERVARVLVGQADSRKAGRKPKEIKSSCPLEVVALNRGSFEIALDLPREKFENMDLGIAAVEKLADGMSKISSNGDPLPSGYDAGVLHSLKDMGRILDKGIDEIEIETRTRQIRGVYTFNRDTYKRVTGKIRGPVISLRSIEGRLFMADFHGELERCRIHPPMGEPVTCQFDESLEDTVYEHLRGFVRITGETKEDPVTGRISSIMIKDIEPVLMEGKEFEKITPEEFWQEKSLDQLASEQGVIPIRQLEDIWGKGAELWADSEDFESFLEAAKGIQ